MILSLFFTDSLIQTHAVCFPLIISTSPSIDFSDNSSRKQPPGAPHALAETASHYCGQAGENRAASPSLHGKNRSILVKGATVARLAVGTAPVPWLSCYLTRAALITTGHRGHDGDVPCSARVRRSTCAPGCSVVATI